MTRGNQREEARKKAAALQAKNKSKQTGDPQKRKEQDAKALADKIAAKAALKDAEAGAGGDKNKPPLKKISGK